MSSVKRFYLIDYENVGSKGMEDCSQLLDSDHIHVFFTENTKSIDLDIVDNHGLAELKTHKVPTGKESLDKHLGSYLGYLIGKYPSKEVKIFIISKDKGYDDLIKFWGNASDIVRKERIEISKPKKQQDVKNESSGKVNQTTKTTNSKTANEERTRLNSEIQKHLSKQGYESDTIKDITKIVLKCHGSQNFKSEVHKALQKVYSKPSGVYNDIKPVLNKYS